MPCIRVYKIFFFRLFHMFVDSCICRWFIEILNHLMCYWTRTLIPDFLTLGWQEKALQETELMFLLRYADGMLNKMKHKLLYVFGNSWESIDSKSTPFAWGVDSILVFVGWKHSCKAFCLRESISKCIDSDALWNFFWPLCHHPVFY